MSKSCHVLIIEDEPLLAMHVQHILEEQGATSFAFADTQARAIASALEHPPEVITSDVMLVQGTGPLAIKAIYRELGRVPVIFITATPADCEPCESPGPVLRKPVDQAELAAAFRTAVGGLAMHRTDTGFHRSPESRVGLRPVKTKLA